MKDEEANQSASVGLPSANFVHDKVNSSRMNAELAGRSPTAVHCTEKPSSNVIH